MKIFPNNLYSTNIIGFQKSPILKGQPITLNVLWFNWKYSSTQFKKEMDKQMNLFIVLLL